MAAGGADLRERAECMAGAWEGPETERQTVYGHVGFEWEWPMMGRRGQSGGAGSCPERLLGQWNAWEDSGTRMDNRNNTTGQLQQLCAMLGR